MTTVLINIDTEKFKEKSWHLHKNHIQNLIPFRLAF